MRRFRVVRTPRGLELVEKERVGRTRRGLVRGQDKSNSAESKRLDPPAPVVQRR